MFENPFDFALEKVCVAASSRNLRVSDADKRRCFAMASRESVMVCMRDNTLFRIGQSYVKHNTHSNPFDQSYLKQDTHNNPC